MAAKKALRSILEDPTLSLVDRKAQALQSCRNRHMSVASLTKLLEDLFPEKEVPNKVERVEECVEHLARLAHEELGKSSDKPKPPPSIVVDGAEDRPDSCDVTLDSNSERNGSDTGTRDEPVQTTPTPAISNPTSVASPSDLTSLTATMKQLQLSFEQFAAQSADREVRFIQRIKTLERTVSDAQRATEEREEKLNQKISELTKKITSLANKKANTDTSPPSSTTTKQNEESAKTGDTAPTSLPPSDQRQPTPRQTEDLPSRPTQILKSAWTTRMESRENSVLTDFSRKTTPSVFSSTSQGQPMNTPHHQTASKDQQRRTSSAVAPGTSSIPLKGAVRVKRAVYFVGGIDLESSEDSVREYCKQRNVRLFNCRFLPSKIFGTKSARITVAATDASTEDIQSDNFWPSNITVRPWSFPSRTLGESNDGQ